VYKLSRKRANLCRYNRPLSQNANPRPLNTVQEWQLHYPISVALKISVPYQVVSRSLSSFNTMY